MLIILINITIFEYVKQQKTTQNEKINTTSKKPIR